MKIPSIFRPLALAFGLAAALGLAGNAAHAQFVASPLQNGTPVGPSVTGQNTGSGIYFGVNRTGISGHIEAGLGNGDLPVLSSCGSTPTLADGSTDMSGTVTMGTTATGCVITFGTPYSVAPACTVTWRATPLASQSYTVSASAITLTQTSTSNNLIDYVCVAKSGG